MIFRFYLIEVALVLLAGVMNALLSAAAIAQSVNTSFYEIERGTVPILITVPHSMPASALIPGIQERNPCNECPQDMWSSHMGHAISDQIEADLGGRPYFLRALFTRRQVDVNVPKAFAFDDPAGEPYYTYWHNTIDAFAAEINAIWGSGLMIDVHSHGLPGESGTIFRGTRDGLTTNALLVRYGSDALVGSNSVIGVMVANGVLFHPDITIPFEDQVEDVFNGGSNVFLHGSNWLDGIDAIQFEFGGQYLNNGAYNDTAAKVAAGFRSHYEHFILPGLPNPQSLIWGTSNVGAWADGANWLHPASSTLAEGATPSTSDQTAVFGNLTTSSTTVAVNGSVTVNRLEFDSFNSYAISGTGTISLQSDSTAVAPTIAVQRGHHQIQTRLSLGDDLAIATTNNGSLHLNNEIDLNGHMLALTGNVFINHQIVGGGTVVNNDAGNLATDGVTWIDGNFRNTGTLLIDLTAGGVSSFQVSGSVELSGTVDVNVESGFRPIGTYTLLTATSNLSIADLSLAADDAERFHLTRQGNSLLLTVARNVPEPTAMLLFSVGGILGLGVVNRHSP